MLTALYIHTENMLNEGLRTTVGLTHKTIPFLELEYNNILYVYSVTGQRQKSHVCSSVYM